MATLADYPHVATGKVRDLYAVDDDTLLLVASDRISAFDHVLTTPIPDKGRVLTAMSVFWFELLGGPEAPAPPIAHHLLARLGADARPNLTEADLHGAVGDPAAFVGAAGDQVAEIARRVGVLVEAHREAASYTPSPIL